MKFEEEEEGEGQRSEEEECYEVAERVVVVVRQNGEQRSASEREFFIENLLVRIHFIIVMIRWTGLAP